MTMFNDEFNRIFKQMSSSFGNLDDVFEMLRNTNGLSEPIYFGYTMTVGPDGKPVIQEYGNVKPDTLPTVGSCGCSSQSHEPIAEKREPLIDTLVDDKEQTLKIVAEMPGVEKTDVKVVVDEDIIHIDAEHGEKSYHVNVPIQHKVESDSPKATYTNGILELTFNLDTKPKGKSVDVL
tara:strand:- start:25 stop:558 length:534 start_codon:yes stop_codon:yes gene_type:complete